MDTLRWGILGTGGIARVHVEAIRAVDGCEVAAVAGRDAARVAAFAAEHRIPASFPSYEALLASGRIDAVYVGTTNDLHHSLVLQAIEAGLPTLCEKPFALNLEQAAEMVAAARRSGVLLMEAMWIRFQPFWDEMQRRVATGQIGPVRHVMADICADIPRHPTRRWYDRAQGGGALLDTGVYPLSLAIAVLGPPEALVAAAVEAPSGVDEQVGFVTRHRDGAMAVMSASFSADTAFEALISGTDGRLRLHTPFLAAPRITLERRGEVVEAVDLPITGTGYEGQIDEMRRCVRDGRTESAVRSLDDTLAVMRWLDAARREIGLRYPGE